MVYGMIIISRRWVWSQGNVLFSARTRHFFFSERENTEGCADKTLSFSWTRGHHEIINIPLKSWGSQLSNGGPISKCVSTTFFRVLAMVVLWGRFARLFFFAFTGFDVPSHILYIARRASITVYSRFPRM